MLFLIAIIVGYILALVLGLVDLCDLQQPASFRYHNSHSHSIEGFNQYELYFGPETFAILPVAIVTLPEHIGDHTVLGKFAVKIS